MRIALLTRKIDGVMGGMERQIMLISTYFLDAGHEVTIYSLDTGKPRNFYQSHPHLSYAFLGEIDSDQRAGILRRLRRQIEVVKKFKSQKIEVAIAFSTGALWFSAIPAKCLRLKLILTERTGPSVYTLTRAAKFKKLIFTGMYLCDKVIVQMPSYVSSYPKKLQRRITVIPNEVPRLSIQKSINSSRRFCFGYIGRLCHQKQSLQLVLAFLEFRLRYPETELLLCGTGDQVGRIQDEIVRQEDSNISILAPTQDIDSRLSVIDVLIHPAIWEGFPNSVAEALSAGIPVAGFSDCEGLRDLVVDGFNGWVEERTDYVNSIVKLLERVYIERAKIEVYRENCVASVSSFQRELVVKQWLNLISLEPKTGHHPA